MDVSTTSSVSAWISMFVRTSLEHLFIKTFIKKKEEVVRLLLFPDTLGVD
jgi:hypothetical protein